MEWLSKVGRKNKYLGDFLWTISEVKNNIFALLPNDIFAKLSYRLSGRGALDTKCPKTYNEKLWWLRFHYRNPVMKICSDKYEVRNYLKQIDSEFEKYALPMIATFKEVSEIDLKQFKEETIFKLNVGSGANMLYNPQEEFDEAYFRKFFERRMKHDYSLNNREWNFHDVKPVIIAERVLRDSEGRLPVDYKFMCFEGQPKYVYYSEGTMDSKGRHNVSGTRFTNVYDMNWEITDIVASYPRRPDIVVQKPKCFELMKRLAADLSAPFPHVRIDLYEIDGKVYLGEFTFFHSGGCGNISPEYRSLEMGELIDISKIPKEFII